MEAHPEHEPVQHDAQPTLTSFQTKSPSRLGIDFGLRLPICTITAFTSGLALGASHGSTKAAFRFRAENAHRFPTNSTAWYQYHKSKNYKSVMGGLKEGTKLGTKLGAGAMAFCLFEEAVDRARNGNRDVFSTVTAGLAFSGTYSLIARHDIYTAARTAKVGLKLSLAYGLVQDLFASLRGDRPRYIQSVYNAFGN
ncbi:hypothetical protein FQN57_004194 [Myotisia sp. PD_48]|nr:hypothetical protein FQN57_004194 [Myotisia sp. PD_48]